MRATSAGAVLATAGVVREAAPEVACAHCGLAVPPGFVEPGASGQFCCAGCRSAFAILRECGLDGYYGFAERRTTPVQRSGRTYAEFDHPAFQSLYVREAADSLASVELYLSGVHCASCVWLVERVPLILPGVARAELNAPRSLARIEWDPASLPLSRVAQVLESLGYAPHPPRGRQRESLRRREDRESLVRIGIAGAIAINVMLASLALYSGWLSGGIEASHERFFRWVALALTLPAVLGPGRVFFAGAWAAIRLRALHLDLPIAIALAAGFGRGAANTVRDAGPVYFDGVAILIFLLLVGRYLQERGQRAATDASELLHSLTPGGARVVRADASIEEVPAAALLPGMIIDVRAGETFAADGVVIAGASSVDLSLLTGESRPVDVGREAAVFAGSLNVSAPLQVRVERSGEESRVGRILSQVEASSRRRAPIVLLANRLAGIFVGVILALAAITLVVSLGRDSGSALDNAIALLVVTCPCALAMATPLAVTVASGRAARQGIFVRGGDAIEALSRPGIIFLDKTGTITESRTSLLHWEGPEWVKPLVLALEQESTHTIAAGFRKAFAAVAVPRVEESRHVTGGGIRGSVAGHTVVVGSPAFVASHSTRPPAIPLTADPALTPVHIAIDGVTCACAGFGDPIRPDAAASVAALRASGWRVRILSGDARPVVRAVGEELGIAGEDCIAECTPEDKLRHIERARAAGWGTVVMVGDGVNDGAAIAAATVGVAVHGGAEASLAIADVYMTKAGLGRVVDLCIGAGRTMRVIRRNIAFSLLYNAAGVALAMTGTITPLIAAVMMPMSSLTVILGSWYGRTFEERT
jgi:Cu2+-exporting ATPase